MTQEKDSKDNFSEMRKRAEESIDRNVSDMEDIDITALSPDEVQRLLHELRVHQIELEMQNEDLRQVQVKLEELKDRYLDLYDFAPVGYVTLNEKGLILEANLTAVRLLGEDRQTLIKRPFSRFVCQEFGDAYYLYLQKVFETQSKQTCEIELSREDGTQFYAQLESVSVQDENGQFSRCRTIVTDISERKDAEEMQRESEDRYRDLVENIQDLICTHDLQGKLLFVNQASATVVGYSPADLVGTDMRNFLAPEVRDQFDAYLAAIQRDGQASGLMLVQTKSGEKRIWEYRNTLSTEGHGEPIVRGFAQDITERKKMEENLREAEQRYRRLFEQAPTMYVITRNEQGVPLISDCNDLFLTSLGHTREEVQGKPLADFYSPESRAELLEHGGYPRALAGEFFIGERQLVRSDGSLVQTLLYTATEVDPSGRVTGTRAMFVDITERKRAEEKLREREEFLSSVVENIPDMIFIKDAKELRFTRFNKAGEKLLGYTREDLIGKNDYDFFPKEQADFFTNKDMDVLKSGRIYDIPEEPIETKTGRRIIHTKKIPLLDKDGVPAYLLGISEDITERKRTENALKESDKQYRTLFEDSIDGLYSVLRDGTIKDANPSFCELFGYTREEIIGKDVVELYLDPADRSRFQEAIEKTGFVKDYEIKFQDRNGTEVDCLVFSSVIFEEDGSITGYRGILRDLTEQKTLQKQLLQSQKMEAVGTLAGGIAHDFNNLLQVVLGYSELVLTNVDQPDHFKDDLGKILLAARNGAELVQRLLTFSRKTETKPLDLNLNQRVRQNQNFLERTIPKMINIEMVLEDDLADIHADPTQMDQVLMNLSVNARDAMPEGGKLILETANVVIDEDYARSHLEAKPGRYVLLRVSDTGSGIDKETLEHIFEPFFTTKGLGQGTGLGLAMVFGIVKQHQGFINCYSEVGHGTTFKIYLPAIISLTQSDLPIITSMPQGGTETILLVDDEELIRDLGQRILSKAGYTILTASNGEEALDLYRSNKGNISLVMLDLIMPGMGGNRCLEELLVMDPNVKILVASGYSADGATKQTLSGGAKGFVGKPFDIRQVLEMVRKVLDEA